MTREQRKRAKVARRRRRTERMRVTAARVNVLEDGSSVLVARKVRGPRRGAAARAVARAALVRLGGDRLMGVKERKSRLPWRRPKIDSEGS